MPVRIFFLFLCFTGLRVFAQTDIATAYKAHCNVNLIKYVKKQSNPNEKLNLLVRGNISAINNAVTKSGGIVKYTIGSISAIQIQTSALNTLLHTPGIERVEGYQGSGTKLDEQSDINTRADSVKQGIYPLPHGYTGKGVVVGVIDGGIDFTHPDFKDSTGKTRIAYLWDQLATSGGTTPSFGYGQEWTATDINNGTCTSVETNFGHGSNVTGAAAGNGLALNKYAGIATNADIITVACNLGPNFLNDLVDAANYIYTHANQLNEPCVINASVGTYGGSHDGSDLAAQMLDSLITQQNGRSFVAAAGDAGAGDGTGNPIHLGYKVQTDSAFTWFKNLLPTIGQSLVDYEIWARKSQFDSVYFRFGADMAPASSFKKRGNTRYYNILNDFNLTNGLDSLKDSLYAGPNRLGLISVYASIYNDSLYDIVVEITPDSTNYLWRLTTMGSGYFDCWSNALVMGTSTMKAIGLPTASAYPDISQYRLPDLTQSITSSFQCSNNVITVADYFNRNWFINYNNDTTKYPTDTVGARSLSSSIGPTRDGRIKPDITAPGSNTIATGNATEIALLIANSQQAKVAQGGMHNVNGGTSLASPIVTGIVALYLQKNPTASWSQIKNAIETTAIMDQFTGSNLPDNKWGYGKVNAYAAIKSSLIYGCTDSTATNYNPKADVSNDSCTYLSTLASNIASVNQFNIFPNPASGIVNIRYQLTNSNSPYSVEITDESGRAIDVLSLNSANGIYKYDLSLLAQGVYFCKLVNNEKTLQTLKLLKL